MKYEQKGNLYYQYQDVRIQAVIIQQYNIKYLVMNVRKPNNKNSLFPNLLLFIDSSLNPNHCPTYASICPIREWK